MHRGTKKHTLIQPPKIHRVERGGIAFEFDQFRGCYPRNPMLMRGEDALLCLEIDQWKDVKILIDDMIEVYYDEAGGAKDG